MSLIHNIDHLARAPGVVSVYVEHDPPAFRGNATWRSACRHAMSLRYATEEDVINIAAGPHTIYVQREGDQIAAVVVKTGHAICKSLRRMLRRAAAGSLRAPRNASSPEPDRAEPSFGEPVDSRDLRGAAPGPRTLAGRIAAGHCDEWGNDEPLS